MLRLRRMTALILSVFLLTLPFPTPNGKGIDTRVLRADETVEETDPTTEESIDETTEEIPYDEPEITEEPAEEVTETEETSEPTSEPEETEPEETIPEDTLPEITEEPEIIETIPEEPEIVDTPAPHKVVFTAPALRAAPTTLTLPSSIPSTPVANEVYIYNNVPADGNPEQSFDYTLTLSGTLSTWFANSTMSGTTTFSLKNNQYAHLTIACSAGRTLSMSYAHFDVTITIVDPDLNTSTTVDGIAWNLGWGDSALGYEGDINNQRLTLTQTSNSDYVTSSYCESETPSGSFSCSGNTAYWTSIAARANKNVGGTIVFTNEVITEDVTVTGSLTDSLEPSSSFSYDYSYGYQGQTSLDSGSFTLTGNDSYTFYDVPRGATVTVTQVSSAAHDTSPQLSQALAVSTSGNTLTFSNSRKAFNVTVNEVLLGGSGSDSFSFTAAMDYGGTAVSFTGTGSSFTLQNNGSYVLTDIPYGVELTVTQAGTVFETISTDGTVIGEFELTVGPITSDKTITFTNTEPSNPAPTDLNTNIRSFIPILAIGTILITVTVVIKRQGDDNIEGGDEI